MLHIILEHEQPSKEAPMQTFTDNATKQAIADVIGHGPSLHEIDFEDIAISPYAVSMITKAARAVMDQHMPGSRSETLTPSQAVALFLDHLYWDEYSGGLIMCSDMEEKAFCLPIPKEHWSVNQPVCVQ
jgi:hypothetical protein